MKLRFAWVFGILLQAGCGEQPVAPQTVEASSNQGRAPRNRGGEAGQPSERSMAEVREAIKVAGGRLLRGRLTFSGTQITDKELECVTWIPRIERLNLNGTRITDDGMRQIIGQTHLRELDLSHTEITDSGIEQLKPLVKLRHIDLTGTRITDGALVTLAEFPVLNMIGLTDTQVSDTGLKRLSEFPDLRTLHLSPNQFSEATIQTLAESTPNLRIMYFNDEGPLSAAPNDSSP